MKRILFSLFICISTSITAFANENTDLSGDVSASTQAASTLNPSETNATQTMPLLPQTLGPMERLLWSERGAMRRVFDFPLTPEGREQEMKNRRSMLVLHQASGLATLASLVGTLVLGQMVFNGEKDLSQMHKAMAWTSVGAYITTGTLSIFTPPPLVRRKEWNSVSTHKFLAGIHLTGMLLTPVMGTLVADDQAELRSFHLTSGYVTTFTFGAAIIVTAF